MTPIKSLLLGSAAGIVAVASAQAADLPTKKAAPVEYVKVCNVGGITGWTLPGSDTCVKFSGYLTAQVEGGNLNNQYNYGSLASLTTAGTASAAGPETYFNYPNATVKTSTSTVGGGGGVAATAGSVPGTYVSSYGSYPAGNAASTVAGTIPVTSAATTVSGVPNYPAGTTYPAGATYAAGTPNPATPGYYYPTGTVIPSGTLVPSGTPITTNLLTGAALSNSQLNQRVLIANSAAQANTKFYRPNFGWTSRMNFGFDIASNTAYGPLIGHFDLNAENGNGFDNTGTAVYVNTGYVTWAGITAGKAQSFYSFTGGGDNWANFASPDRKGFNEPELLAYTASFGGGFTATVSAESPGGVGGSGGGTDYGAPNYANIGVNSGTASQITYGGMKWPDFVGALHVKQGWGEAQVSGVIHNVNVAATGYNSDETTVGAICGLAASSYCNYEHNQIGWGVDAGVKINLPSFGAGDDALLTGSYTQSAVWYSGLPDMMWGEDGQVNGNGQPMFMQDAYFNPITNQWAKPTAWSVSALIEHHFTPQFYLDLEGSVGQLKWSNQNGGCTIYVAGCTALAAANGALSPTATTWLVGADLGWNPVNNLNFDLELMYQSTNQSAPNGFLGTIYNYGQSNVFFVPGDWHGVSDGFAGRFRITRYF